MKTQLDVMANNVLVRSPLVRHLGCPRPRAGSGNVLARVRAMAKHPRVMPYRRLMLAVVVVNLAATPARTSAPKRCSS
jgi:hypothetical protein